MFSDYKRPSSPNQKDYCHALAKKAQSHQTVGGHQIVLEDGPILKQTK